MRWVVDPLDGTVNFLFGIPQWAVSIAAEDAEGTLDRRRLRPRARRAVLRRARRPPTLDGRPITASTKEDLATAMIGTGFGYDAEVRRAQAAVVARLLPEVRDLRRFGAAAIDLAWTACGRLDAYYEHGLNAVGPGRRRADLRVRRAGRAARWSRSARRTRAWSWGRQRWLTRWPPGWPDPRPAWVWLRPCSSPASSPSASSS